MAIISRRDLLKSVAIAGAATAVPAIGGPPVDAAEPQTVTPAAAAAGPDALESLTSAESDTLEAIVARLIPADENGPGAKEARAARYIDRALGGALSGSREAYRSGLAALDAYARFSKGSGFHQLATADQDAVLTEVERGAATGFTGSSTQFFNLVRTHTIQGTFGDPYYGGNAGFVGWDLIGYPGIRTQVTPADQTALEHDQLKPNHRSAYDSPMFTKATVELDIHDGHDVSGRASHGD
jgi:gluconate 2-dehydrogenase gamma chain